MDSAVLPPDLQRFAAEAVASGRFRDMDDVVRTGVDLLHRRESARAAFLASLEAAQRDGEQNGFHCLDEVLTQLEEIIAEEERGRA